jgi:hypothetical protein
MKNPISRFRKDLRTRNYRRLKQWIPLTAAILEDSGELEQYLNARFKQVAEIAAIFKVPPGLIATH